MSLFDARYFLNPPVVGITSTFEFAAAHRLPHHNGKCSRLHGHNYRLEFTQIGAVKTGTTDSDEGMVDDFSVFDAEIKQVLDELDHYCLNDIPGLENPTAEHLALYLLARVPLAAKVVVWETGRHCAFAARADITE